MKMTLLLFFTLAPLYADVLPPSVEETFFCTDGTQNYELYLKKNNTLSAKPQNGLELWHGTYHIQGDSIHLQLPIINFVEASGPYEFAKGLIITFETPSIKCHAIGHTLGKLVRTNATCPKIRIIPNTSYEENAFEFYPSGMVKRRQWKQLATTNDALYNESLGIYLIEGETFSMAFGDRKEERFLTGSIVDDNSITINELEPNQGVCKLQ